MTDYQYNSEFRTRAKALFFELRSLSAVQRELRRMGYKHPPNAKTLTRWRNEEGWTRELANLDRVSTADFAARGEDDLGKLLSEVSSMRKISRQRIVKKDDICVFAGLMPESKFLGRGRADASPTGARCPP